MHAVVDNLSRWVLERARKRKKKNKRTPSSPRPLTLSHKLREFVHRLNVPRENNCIVLFII